MSGSTNTAPGMLIRTKGENGVLTWQWLGPVLLALVTAAGGFAWNTVDGRISDQGAEIKVLQAQQRAIEISEITLRNTLANVQAAQEREHKLLVKIAAKLGIEVAE